MARAFAEIAFTLEVLAFQERHGSAKSYRKFLEPASARGDRLGEIEAAFIAERDGFYQATVSATGWPYVQFRGGPKGFLKVRAARTVAYADFRGKRQYLSVGNLATDDRISLILIDDPNRRRLKLWGHARTVELADELALVSRLHDTAYAARPERAVAITVAAFDWNCPQHIPQRLTFEEFQEHLAPLLSEISQLREENAALQTRR